MLISKGCGFGSLMFYQKLSVSYGCVCIGVFQLKILLLQGVSLRKILACYVRECLK